MPWKLHDVQTMAIKIKSSWPLSVNQLLHSEEWRGGDLIQLENSTASAKADDLITNYCWVKPIVAQFRDRVPSGFYLTDVFLFLDQIMMGKLLVPAEEGQSKHDLAAEEGKKIKNLVGSLRALWRSSTLV